MAARQSPARDGEVPDDVFPPVVSEADQRVDADREEGADGDMAVISSRWRRLGAGQYM